MLKSANLGLNIFEGNDNVKRTAFVENFEILDKMYGPIVEQASEAVYATGSNNTFVISDESITSYYKSLKRIVFFDKDWTGTGTVNFNNLGAKHIKDCYGTTQTNLKKDIPYHVCYNGSDFILLGKGGGGNATANDILAGKTASTDAGIVIGNIPILTGIRAATGVSKWPDNGLAVYPEQGYQKGGSGDGEIKVSQQHIINIYGINADKIVSGQEIAGVFGNAQALKRATGSVSVAYGKNTSVNLGFYPTILIFRYDSRTKSGDAKWEYGVFTPVLKFSCWKDKSYSDSNVVWDNPKDPRTSTGFTATGEYYDSSSTWTYEGIGF